VQSKNQHRQNDDFEAKKQPSKAKKQTQKATPKKYTEATTPNAKIAP